MPLLEVEDLRVAYGKIEAIRGISFTVEEGEIVTLIGANGAGKTTTLKTISGLRKVRAGSITFEGDDITELQPYERVKRGISQAPEDSGFWSVTLGMPKYVSNPCRSGRNALSSPRCHLPTACVEYPAPFSIRASVNSCGFSPYGELGYSTWLDRAPACPGATGKSFMLTRIG